MSCDSQCCTASSPLSRYVTVNTTSNLETAIMRQLVANFTANNASQLTTPVKCRDCLNRIVDKKRDMVYTIHCLLNSIMYSCVSRLSTSHGCSTVMETLLKKRCVFVWSLSPTLTQLFLQCLLMVWVMTVLNIPLGQRASESVFIACCKSSTRFAESCCYFQCYKSVFVPHSQNAIIVLCVCRWVSVRVRLYLITYSLEEVIVFE